MVGKLVERWATVKADSLVELMVAQLVAMLVVRLAQPTAASKVVSSKLVLAAWLGCESAFWWAN